MLKTHLYDWAHAGKIEEIRMYLRENPDEINAFIGEGYTFLHVASLFGQESLVSMLLGAGALVNINADNESRATALHAAIMYRDEDVSERIVQNLLSHGAELNATQKGGQTALHHAVSRGSVALVSALMEAGADPFLKDDSGQTPAALAQSLSDRLGESGPVIRSLLTRIHTTSVEV